MISKYRPTIDERIMRRTESFEGFRGEPYKDHSGNWTIGYGTKLPLRPDEASDILRRRMADIWGEILATQGYDFCNELPLGAHAVLIDIAFSIGTDELVKMEKMWDALREHNFEQAADELLATTYTQQMGSRAKRNAEKLRWCYWREL